MELLLFLLSNTIKMIDSWPGLLFPLWLALLFEPTKEVNRTGEKKKPKIENVKTVEGDTTVKIKTGNP
jgi:hypothetical protein